MKKGIYANCVFLQAIHFRNPIDESKHGYILILTLDHVLLLSESSKNRRWIVPTNTLVDVRHNQ